VKLTQPLAEAFLRLRGNEGFQLIVEAIRQDGNQAMLDLVDAPLDHVPRLQGRAAYCKEFITGLNGAADLLEKVSKQQPGEYGADRSTRISTQGRGAF
jgi:hypothetical protein